MIDHEKDPARDDSSTSEGKNEDVPNGEGNESSESNEDTASGGSA